MLRLLINVHLLNILCVVVLTFASAEIRTITSTLNPNCDNCNDTVVYIQAKGQNDVVHQIWDFSRGLPTVINFFTGLTAILNIEWIGSTPRNIVLSEKPIYSFALALHGIIEYDDLKDKALFDPHYPHRVIPLKHFKWNRTASVLGLDNDAMVLMRHTVPAPHKTTTFEFRLETSSSQSSSALLPHLLFTPNASIMDVTLGNLSTNNEYKHARFALHFVMASTDNRSETMYRIIEKSLDDEHAPGVFEMLYVKTPKSYKTNSADGGFLQFRPVAYRDYMRDIATSTTAKVGPFIKTRLPSDSVMEVFYSNTSMFPAAEMLVEDIIISFGEPGDGFYKRYNFTAWESSLGYGMPPAESFSTLVVTVMTLGLALPALLALLGLGYLMLRRRRAEPSLLDAQ